MARRASHRNPPRGDDNLRRLERGMIAGELTPAWHAAWERAGRPGRDPRLDPQRGDVFLTRSRQPSRFDEAYGDPRETVVVLEGRESPGPPPSPHTLAARHYWRREASPAQTRHTQQVSGDAPWLVRVRTSGGEYGQGPRERWFHVTSLVHLLQGATVLRREPDVRENPPRGDDELRRLERRAAQGDLAAERAYHAALERRGLARDRGLMLPRLEVVEGIWTPRAEVLCYGCHGPSDPHRFRDGRLTPEQWAVVTTPYPEAELREWTAVTTCDRCNRRIALSDKVAHEHELVKQLREALRGTGAIVNMEQTGGMCSGVSVWWPQNRFGGYAFIVEDDEAAGVFHMTTHADQHEFWNGDPDTDNLSAGTHTAVGIIELITAAARG